MDPRQTPASELVRQALADTRELVRMEVALAPLVIGAILLVVAIGPSAFAWSALPRKPAEKTQTRIKTDMTLVKEHVTT